jgi:hypothetical protein
MNQSELTAVMERAGARLQPDVDALVAEGVRRGHRRRQRRLTVSVAAGAVVILGLGSAVIPGAADVGAGVDPIAVTPADPVSTSADQRALATVDVVRGRVLDLFAERQLGYIAYEPIALGPGSGMLDGYEMTTQVDGASVSLTAGDFSRDGTDYSPARACDFPGCHELTDGSWLWLRSGDGGDGVANSFGFRANWATVFTVDGWMLTVEATNSVDPDAGRPDVVSEQPVLSRQEVEALATSDIWFP